VLGRKLSILNLDNRTIEAYCKIYRKLKEEGNLIPDTDLIIAATAIAYDLVIEIKEAHFHRIEALGLKLK
jgi:tRNA(fMet)-specific endonuclease VapC